MAQRRDPNLEVGTSYVDARRRTVLSRLLGAVRPVKEATIRPAKRSIGDRHYRGFDLSGGARFTLVRPFRWSQFRSYRDPGWSAVCLKGEAASPVLEVLVTECRSGKLIAKKQIPLASQPAPVTLPDLSGLDERLPGFNVTVSLSAVPGVLAFLMVHEVLDRTPLIALCKGRGVEIGPGLNPQIQHSADVDVLYIEQATPEQWETLYNQKGQLNIDPSLWKRYVQGDAYPLPVQSGSLDFIFSSHVFEHLANPIGHLKHWHEKLREGGLVAAIVPDFASCKDYVFEATPMSEIEEEHAEGTMRPGLRHYARWAAVRAPLQDPEELMKLNRSIHVHFYTRDNIRDLLAFACRSVGYRRYELTYTPNHKDFYFALWK